jgi:hypothetical protein
VANSFVLAGWNKRNSVDADEYDVVWAVLMQSCLHSQDRCQSSPDCRAATCSTNTAWAAATLAAVRSCPGTRSATMRTPSRRLQSPLPPGHGHRQKTTGPGPQIAGSLLASGDDVSLVGVILRFGAGVQATARRMPLGLPDRGLW